MFHAITHLFPFHRIQWSRKRFAGILLLALPHFLVGCGITEVSITRGIRLLLPLFAAMIVALLIVTYVPELSLWLPRQFGF